MESGYLQSTLTFIRLETEGGTPFEAEIHNNRGCQLYGTLRDYKIH